MGIFYTSFKKKKVNKLPRTKSLLEARENHRKYLISLGIDPDRKIDRNQFRAYNDWWVTKEYAKTKERKHVEREPRMGNGGTKPVNNFRLEESQKFTVAPAYNKGAYQVITKSNIKDIGR